MPGAVFPAFGSGFREGICAAHYVFEAFPVDPAGLLMIDKRFKYSRSAQKIRNPVFGDGIQDIVDIRVVKTIKVPPSRIPEITQVMCPAA